MGVGENGSFRSGKASNDRKGEKRNAAPRQFGLRRFFVLRGLTTPGLSSLSRAKPLDRS